MQSIKVWTNLHYKFFNIFKIVCVILIFTVLLHPNLWSKSSLRQKEEITKYTESFYTITNNKTGERKVIGNDEFLSLEKGCFYTVSTRLTYDGSKDEIPYGFIRAAHIHLQVLLDGQVLFSYMPNDVNKWDKALSPGFIHKDFPLPHDCEGKLLQIVFYPVLEGNIKYNVSDIFFGDYKEVTYDMVSHDLIHNILTILGCLLGCGALVFSAVSLKGKDYREGVIIGAFSLILSLYSISESYTNRFFIGNPYYLYFLNYTTFSLIPLSFMCVMREVMRGKHQKICNIVIISETVFFILEMTLHFCGIKDMREMLSIVHVIDFSELILMAVLLLTIEDRKRKIRLELEISPIILGAIIDSILYFGHFDIGFNDTTFTILGILIFLCKELISKALSQHKRITSIQQHTIEGMATLIESRDGSTGEHVRNTGVYAKLIAEEMFKRGMYPNEITIDFVEMIGHIAPLHDVGKIKISDTILNKPSEFTNDEYEIMKTHAELGGKIIKDILKEDLNPTMLKMAENLATYHHERWDGKGYPKGLKGEEIPLEARIMSVADVFDALTSKRVYKEKMEADEVFNEMRKNEGTQFQKEIVEVLISIRSKIETYKRAE